MAAYRRVYDSPHLQADCQEPGSAPEPYARYSSVGYLFMGWQWRHFVLYLCQLTSFRSIICQLGFSPPCCRQNSDKRLLMCYCFVGKLYWSYRFFLNSWLNFTWITRRIFALNSTHCVMLYLQNGDRIVTIDSVTSRQAVYNITSCVISKIPSSMVDECWRRVAMVTSRWGQLL